MPGLTISLEKTPSEYLDQLRYALTFLSEAVVKYEIDAESRQLVIEFAPGTDTEAMRAREDSGRELGLRNMW